MATYVPGSETYLPDIKPFTPDYKFLSAVLDTRQDKYSTNWKATNDVYNKVVYADLSRTDTTEQRDQYIQKLAPSLEKIAGMDLSLAQNADSAKAVFAPFFEDKLIVKDMVYTANYRKQMEYANRLLDSPNREQNEKYWTPGVKALQYRMEDFVNGNVDQALNAGLPRYVEDADLYETALKILGEQEPPLTMKVGNLPSYNADGSVNPDWLITQQNGDLVTGPALQFIQKALQDDPRVQQAYQTQAYVASRDFAAEGIAAGAYGSVQDGQQAWATETIRRIEANNNEDLLKTQSKLKEKEDINVRWDTYQKTTGIIPGSEDEKIMKEQLSSYEATKAALENQMQIQDLVQKPIAEGSEGTLNRAYQLLMHANMMGDMVAAAENFSMRGFESIPNANPYAVQEKQFKYDMAKMSAQAQNARINAQILENQKQANRIEFAKLKGELVFDENGKSLNPLIDVLGDGSVRSGDAATTGFAVDKDGNIDPNFNVVESTTLDYAEQNDKITGYKAEGVTQALVMLQPTGQDGKQNYTITVGGKKLTGNIAYIKNVLLAKDEKTGAYKNTSAINQLFDQYSEQIINTDELKKQQPDLVTTSGYSNLQAGMLDLIEDKRKLDLNVQSAYKIQKGTYDKTKLLALGNSDLKGYMDAGMPDIWRTDASGVVTPYTREQYIAEVTRLAREGKVTNYNSSGWDNNNDEKYLQDQTYKDEYINYVDTEYTRDNGTKYTTTKRVYSDKPLPNARKSIKTQSLQFVDQQTGKVVRATDRIPTGKYKRLQSLDEKSVRSEAAEAYDLLQSKMNQGLTGSLTDQKDLRTATLKSIQAGAGNTPGDLSLNPTYVGAIDPKSPNAYGNQYAANMFRQINNLAAAGISPMYVEGSLNNVQGDIKGDFSLGEKVLKMYKDDLRSYILNPKSPNSPSAMPRAEIEYMPVYGATDDGEKTTAGYRIKFNDEWLASKVKGPTEGQYGAIKSTDIDKLSNGVSVVYEQKDDISPLSNRMVSSYSSPVLTGIAASTNNYYEVKPQVDGNTVGSYRFVKVSDQEYMLNFQYNEYIPSKNGIGGGFKPGPWRSERINIGPEGAGRSLDRALVLVKGEFAKKGAFNSAAKSRDVAINGKK